MSYKVNDRAEVTETSLVRTDGAIEHRTVSHALEHGPGIVGDGGERGDRGASVRAASGAGDARRHCAASD